MKNVDRNDFFIGFIGLAMATAAELFGYLLQQPLLLAFCPIVAFFAGGIMQRRITTRQIFQRLRESQAHHVPTT
jgi:hypothetical protein